MYDEIFLARKPMEKIASCNWESAIVSPERLAKQIKPGMSIFLGIHSPFFTDPLMDLIQSGASKDSLPKSYILISEAL